MNPNEQRFFDLAMKLMAHQSSEAEEAEFNILLARNPELQREYDRLQSTSGIARVMLPLLNSTEATGDKLPAYARERLQTKVRETLAKAPEHSGRSRKEQSPFLWRWRWLLGLSSLTATMIIFLLLPNVGTRQTSIQLAMLDAVGTTRGTETNSASVLEQNWHETRVVSFSTSQECNRWLQAWPIETKKTTVKILYDLNEGQILVSGRIGSKSQFQKSFSLSDDKQLSDVINEAKQFITEQISK